MANRNEGHLDDQTSYPDEDDEVYDPEVDDIRDESYLHGEFMEEQSSIDWLTETDVIRIQTESVFYWIKRKEVDFVQEEERENKQILKKRIWN